MALLHQRDCDEVIIPEARADRSSLDCGGFRSLELTADHVLQQDGDQHIAELDTVIFVSSEPLPAREPSRRRSRLPSKQQVVTDPECAERPRPNIARVDVGVMGALQTTHIVVVAAKHVGRSRKQLEILRRKRSRPICPRQRLVGVRPRSPSVRLTTPLDVAADMSHRFGSRICREGAERLRPIFERVARAGLEPATPRFSAVCSTS